MKSTKSPFVLLALLTVRCGGMTGPQAGSESHFLDPCRTSNECADGLSCLKGSCSRPCARDADCTDLLSIATCSGAAATGSDAAMDGRCTASCVSAEECSRLAPAAAACAASDCNLVGVWQNGGGFNSSGMPITRCSAGAVRFDASGSVSLLGEQGWVARGVYAVCGDHIEGPHVSEVFAANPNLKRGCGPGFDVTTGPLGPLGADASVSSCTIDVDTTCPESTTYFYSPCLP